MRTRTALTATVVAAALTVAGCSGSNTATPPATTTPAPPTTAAPDATETTMRAPTDAEISLWGDAIADTDFDNATIPSGGPEMCPSGVDAVTLVDGSFTDDTGATIATLPLRAFTDLDGDGLADAIVAMVCGANPDTAVQFLTEWSYDIDAATGVLTTYLPITWPLSTATITSVEVTEDGLIQLSGDAVAGIDDGGNTPGAVTDPVTVTYDPADDYTVTDSTGGPTLADTPTAAVAGVWDNLDDPAAMQRFATLAAWVTIRDTAVVPTDPAECTEPEEVLGPDGEPFMSATCTQPRTGAPTVTFEVTEVTLPHPDGTDITGWVVTLSTVDTPSEPAPDPATDPGTSPDTSPAPPTTSVSPDTTTTAPPA